MCLQIPDLRRQLPTQAAKPKMLCLARSHPVLRYVKWSVLPDPQMQPGDRGSALHHPVPSITFHLIQPMELFIYFNVTYLGASMKSVSVMNGKISANLDDGKWISLCAAAPDRPHFVPLVL